MTNSKTRWQTQLLFASLALVLLSCLTNAAQAVSQPTADTSYFVLALGAAIAVLALAYMASYVFSLPHIRPIINSELVQVLATGLIAFALVGTQLGVDQYLTDILAATGDTSSSSMMQVAQAQIASLAGTTEGVIRNLGDASLKIGKEASKGVFCNFLGVGFSVVNCSPFNAFRGSLTSAAFTTSVALADTYAQMFLLSLASSYAFSFLIPLGLFFRCFKISRSAGGALIAIGFGFYTAYPTVIVATNNLLHDVNAPTVQSIPDPPICEPKETNVAISRWRFTDYADKLRDFDLAEGLTYWVMVRVLFLSILNLIITLGFIRAFAHVIGSEIDVSTLARIS